MQMRRGSFAFSHMVAMGSVNGIGIFLTVFDPPPEWLGGKWWVKRMAITRSTYDCGCLPQVDGKAFVDTHEVESLLRSSVSLARSRLDLHCHR